MTRIAQHGHRLANLVDFLEMVRNEQERDALRLKFADPHEEPLDLLAVELGCGLIENDQPRTVGQRARDLHKLPRLNAQIAGAHLLRHRDVPAVEDLARLPAKFRPPDQAAPRRMAVDKEVLGHRQVGNDRGMLIDAGDPRAPGAAVRDGRRELAAEADLAAVGRTKSGQDAHQSGLACAVAADERMGFPGQDADARVLQRHCRPVALGDADRLDDRRLLGPAFRHGRAHSRGIRACCPRAPDRRHSPLSRAAPPVDPPERPAPPRRWCCRGPSGPARRSFRQSLP